MWVGRGIKNDLKKSDIIYVYSPMVASGAFGFIDSVFLLLENHGLRTPDEGINQRYLKNWADVADKICFGRT